MLRSIIILSIIGLVGISGVQVFAQEQNDLATSLARPWKHHTHYLGFSVDMPDYFFRGTLTMSQTQWYIHSGSTSWDSVTILIGKVGKKSKNALRKQLAWLKKDGLSATEKIDSSCLSRSSYILWTQDIPARHVMSYTRGFLTKEGLYQLSIEYAPEYRQAVNAMLPRLIESFRTGEFDSSIDEE